MAKKWLTREDSIQYLNEAFYGHLATTSNNQPLSGSRLIMFIIKIISISTPHQGQKLENIRKNSRICFEVSHPISISTGKKPCQFGVHYWSVLVFGQANILDDLNLKNVALNLFIKNIAAMII